MSHVVRQPEKMGLLTIPPPTAPAPTRRVFFDDNIFDPNTNNILTSSSTTTSPPHNHQLPLRTPNYNLSRISSQPPSPQTNQKKKKKEGSSTSDILSLMDSLYNPIPIDIYTSLVKECTLSGDPQTAIHLHTHVTNSRIKNPPLPFINRVLIMFVSCGLLDNARQLFDKMTKRDFNSWATLFVAYCDSDDFVEATSVFISMMEELGTTEFEFPAWIWGCLLKSCACSANFNLGMQVHGLLLKFGNCDDLILSSSLITFYGRFNCLEDANIVFNRAPRHNTMTWTAKILGDCRERQYSEALRDFKEMGRRGVKKDAFTFSSILKACGKMLDRERCGEQVHADAIKHGLVSGNYVRCSLIAMYGRSGLLRDAEQVFFETMSGNEGNNADDCWNAMLMGYIENGMYIEAVKFMYQMKANGMQPQEYLINEFRIACGSFNY